MITMSKVGLTLAVTLSMLAGCAEKPADQDGNLPYSDFIEAKVPPEAVALADGEAQFSVALYQALTKAHGDLFFSPAGVWTVLGMTHAGADGATAAELAQVLHLPVGIDPHPANSALLGSMNFAVQGRMLQISNAMWLQKSYPIQAGFQQKIEANYRGSLKTADFIGDPVGARAAINQWAAAQTRNRITDLISPDGIPSQTRVMLINTAWFKARWANKFDDALTNEDDFYRTDGTTVRTMMMNNRTVFAYAKAPGVQAITMPYEGLETSMSIFLPERPSGLGTFEASLTPEGLAGWFKQLDEGDNREVILSLPRFKMSQRHDLVDAATQLGLAALFSDNADLSRTTRERDARIGALVQHSFLAVDEKGTEAAAATGATENATEAAFEPDPTQPVIFNADHPFMFVIRDNRTGMILFMGRYSGGA